MAPPQGISEKEIDKTLSELKEHQEDIYGELAFNRAMLYGVIFAVLVGYIMTSLYQETIINLSKQSRVIIHVGATVIFILLCIHMAMHAKKNQKKAHSVGEIIGVFEYAKDKIREEKGK